MLRENLKVAIEKSGFIVKEIADKADVKKRTIDKWVGAEETEPKVNDFYKVCKILSVTMEQIVDGESGAEYIREIVKKDPKAIQASSGLSEKGLKIALAAEQLSDYGKDLALGLVEGFIARFPYADSASSKTGS